MHNMLPYVIGHQTALLGGAVLYSEITIDAANINSDLTGFPVRINLSDLPSGFWSNVKSDGGDIRATTSGGDSLPIDMVDIDTTLQTGVVYCRMDLLSSADTIFRLTYGDDSLNLLDPTDTYGRNAVWSGYISTIVAPFQVDRTGSGTVSQGGTNPVETHKFGFKDTVTLPQYVHQGIAYDGTYYYLIGTNAIYKYDESLTSELASNLDPVGDVNTATGETLLNHAGDGCVIGDELFIPVEEYPAATYDKQYIAVFDTSDLSFKRYMDISSTLREISSICLGPDNNLYITDFTDGSSIPYYNTSGVYQGALTLSSTLNSLQGITWFNGYFYVTSDSTKNVIEVQSDGTVNGTALEYFPASGYMEGITSNGTSIEYMVDNLSASIKYNASLLYKYGANGFKFNNGSLYVNNIPADSTWTSSALINASSLTYQSGITSLVDQDAESNRTSLVMDNSPATFGIWNNTNSWLLPSPYVPTPTDTVFYVSLTQNGSISRSLHVDGVSKVSGATADKPTTTGNMAWFIGGEDSTISEPFYGDINFAYVHGDVLTTDWIYAESINHKSPDTFYTITP